jgi:hypothetical protein
VTLELDAVRALCASRIEQANRAEAAVGVAGATTEIAERGVCEQVIAILDGGPPLTSPERIPATTRRTLDDYAAHGLPPGQCLCALLAGDLFGAFARADAETAAAMPAIVAYIHCHMDRAAWGSELRVSSWLRRPRS